MTEWLLYGANGYTGELIAREAVKRGMKPVLAGRSRDKIRKLAAELDCPSAVFELDDHTSLLSSLQNVGAVLHCAGPFSRTARHMMQACLASHVNYFDITGEIDVFELARSVHEKAERSGIVLCPGVGFDVVPTDCLALKLKEALPDATHLTLGFDAGSGPSKGTAKTALESIGLGSRVRRDGKIVEVALGSSTRRIDFGGGERFAVGIPWGDVSTAYYSTGIENIEVFTSMPADTVQRLRRVTWLMRKRWLRAIAGVVIEWRLKPPDQTQRDNNPGHVWGEVRNATGETRTARLKTANGYSLTVNASLGILTDVLARARSPGFATPSWLMGADFVTTLPGSSQFRFDA